MKRGHAMSKSFREGLIAMLEEYRQAPPEGTQEELQDTYKGITLEDAKRVKEGLTALLDSKTREEQRQREREYKALHAELRKKYKRKSGSCNYREVGGQLLALPLQLSYYYRRLVKSMKYYETL